VLPACLTYPPAPQTFVRCLIATEHSDDASKAGY